MTYAHTYSDYDEEGTLHGIGWTCEAGCGAGSYWNAPDSLSPEYVGCMNDAPLLKFMVASRDHVCRPVFSAWPVAVPAGEQSVLFDMDMT